MALSANTVLEVRTGGSDTNGGGFVTGASGTDHSQQDAAQYAVTDAVTNGTTTITSATANFGTDVVGNILYITGGTGSVAAGWYQIISRTDASTIVVDRSTGLTAGTGATLNIGGALASVGQAAAIVVSGNIVWVKAGAYTITASTAVSGGIWSTNTATTIEGYNATRGDLGTAPVLTASGISSCTLINFTSNDGRAVNITVDGASLTAIKGFNGFRSVFYLCTAQNCTNSGFSGSTGGATVLCTATGCSTQPAFQSAPNIFCRAYSNTVTGFGNTTENYYCISNNNSGGSSRGFQLSNGQRCVGCIAYSNGASGFFATSVVSPVFVACIAEANAAYGFDVSNATNPALIDCATYNNTSGATLTTGASRLFAPGAVVGTGTFFVDAAGGDFNLNATAGGGAELRAELSALGATDLYAFRHWVSDAFGGGGGGLVNPIISAGGGLVIRGQ